MDSATLQGYSLEESLGSGHFGVVKRARHVATGSKVAVKIIDKTKLDARAREHLFREVSCMKRLEHPNIIRLYQVFDTDAMLYLVLELGENGDLYDYIAKHPQGVGEDESRDLFRQIAEAVWYCHKLHVVHRDLKPENVIFCQDATRVKLTDFGLSNLFDPGAKLKTSCGSLSYSAPEILLGDTYDAPAVDRWSLGVILYMLLVGEKPFVGGTDSETLTMIMDCKFDVPSELSPESVDLVQQLLVSAPEKRISLDDVFKHPWMMQSCDGDSFPKLPIPLATRLGLSGHKTVVKEMVEEGYASDKDVEQSLQSNSYDYVATTYYLIAAKHLEKKKDSDSPKNEEDTMRLNLRRQRVRKASVPGSGTLALAMSPDHACRTGLHPKLSLPVTPTHQLHRPHSAPMHIFMTTTKEEDEDDEDEDSVSSVDADSCSPSRVTVSVDSPWRSLASPRTPAGFNFDKNESYSRRGLPFPTTPSRNNTRSPDTRCPPKRLGFPSYLASQPIA